MNGMIPIINTIILASGESPSTAGKGSPDGSVEESAIAKGLLNMFTCSENGPFVLNSGDS